jgi:lysyl-tRNA synthetase class 2
MWGLAPNFPARGHLSFNHGKFLLKFSSVRRQPRLPRVSGQMSASLFIVLKFRQQSAMMAAMSSGDVIRAERIKKLQLLKDAGMEAYPARSEIDTTIKDFLAGFEDLEKRGDTRTVGGRVMSLRGQGGILFADVFDGSARGQFVFQKEDAPEAFDLFERTVDVGDFVQAKVVAYRTKRGVTSMRVQEWKMLAKSLQPIPSEWFGLKDEELVLRQRYLDILLNEDVRTMFVRRARFWQCIREFLERRGFLEVETPVLETTPGGADARPFITHHNALDIDVYLRISCGELWQKKLLVAGFPKVFEIGRIFRNEGQSREHLQDYTQLETYEAYSDMEKGKEFVRDLYRHIVKEVYGKYTFEIGGHTVDLAEDWIDIDFCQEIQKRFGINPIACSEQEAIQAVRDAKIEVGEELNKARAVDHLWKSVRKTIAGPAFLVNVPVFLEPLAKVSSKNPNVVERIQILIAGSEVGKGYSELNDPLDQRARFEEQQKMRDKGDDEAQRLDEEYLKAMEFGMPPAFGFGVSERFFAFLENRPAHEAQLFPLLKPKQ